MQRRKYNSGDQNVSEYGQRLPSLSLCQGKSPLQTQYRASLPATYGNKLEYLSPLRPYRREARDSHNVLLLPDVLQAAEAVRLETRSR